MIMTIMAISAGGISSPFGSGGGGSVEVGITEAIVPPDLVVLVSEQKAIYDVKMVQMKDHGERLASINCTTVAVWKDQDKDVRIGLPATKLVTVVGMVYTTLSKPAHFPLDLSHSAHSRWN